MNVNYKTVLFRVIRALPRARQLKNHRISVNFGGTLSSTIGQCEEGNYSIDLVWLSYEIINQSRSEFEGLGNRVPVFRVKLSSHRSRRKGVVQDLLS